MADAPDMTGAPPREPLPGDVAAVYELACLDALVAAALRSPAVPRDDPELVGLARAHAIIRQRRAMRDPDGAIGRRFTGHSAELAPASADGLGWPGRLLASANVPATADGVTTPGTPHTGANPTAVEELLFLHASFSLNTGANRPTSAQTPALREAELVGLALAAALVEHRLYARDPRGEVRRRILAARRTHASNSLLANPSWRALWERPLEGGIP